MSPSTSAISPLSLHDALPICKLAAVVAHEINNPLSGILTYAKLLSRWIDRGEIEDRAQEMRESRSEEHTSELQSRLHLVCRLLLEKKKKMPLQQLHNKAIRTV